MRTYLHISTLLLLGVSAEIVWAKPLCTSDGRVCSGDPVYTWVGGADGKLVNGIAAVNAQKQITLQGTKDVLPSNRVASTRKNVCVAENPKLCVGAQVLPKNTGSTASKPDTVLAIYPTGYVVLKDASGKLKSVPHSDWLVLITEPDLKKTVNTATEGLQAAKQGTLPPEAPCPGCTTAPKPTSVGSLRSMLLSDKLQPDVLPPKCANLLKKLYSKGKNLRSETLIGASLPLSEAKLPSGGDQLDFFHYTYVLAALEQFHPEIPDRKKAHEVALREEAYGKMFQFLRERAPDFWRTYFYLAEDPESSKVYGPHRIRVLLSPSARIVEVTPDGDPELWPKVLNELESRHPGLKAACPEAPVVSFSRVKTPVIAPFIGEDSEIDLFDYCSSEVGYWTHRWFQLIRPHAITGTEVTPKVTP